MRARGVTEYTRTVLASNKLQLPGSVYDGRGGGCTV